MIFLFLISLHFGILIAGFIMCQNYFSVVSSSLEIGFTTARLARRHSLEILQEMHGIFLANVRGNSTLFNELYSNLRFRVQQMMQHSLPWLVHKKAFQGNDIRASFPILSFKNETSILMDLRTQDVAPIDLISSLIRGATILLEYPKFGEFDVNMYLKNQDLRFLTANLEKVLTCIRQLPERAISAFYEEIEFSFATLSIFLVLNVAVLILFGTFAYLKVLILLLLK
jgi:hypothetical protein